MSAVEALAEVLGHHENWQQPRSRTWGCACGAETTTKVQMDQHVARILYEALVAAIRSMPAELKKELGVSPETNGEQK